MCNPRQIVVHATRQLSEAWQREVTRTVTLSASVTGEARVRQSLDTSLGSSALRALEAALAASDSGWIECDVGYRYEVEGGYVVYLPDERALEIVAVLHDQVQAEGSETKRLEGRLEKEISAEGEGRYYEDNWAGRTKEVGEREAQAAADQRLDQTARLELERTTQDAETQALPALEEAARAQAEERLRHEAVERESELSRQASQRLETVGLRCRQAFHQVLARAYRDAILAYANRQGAAGIQCTEDGNVVEIEFTMRS